MRLRGSNSGAFRRVHCGSGCGPPRVRPSAARSVYSGFLDEALGFATELLQQNAIFFLEVFDDSLLVSAHPAGDRDEEELKLRHYRMENLSKVPVAQSSIWSRLNFLAVHD